jgi:hypothetical protein
MLKETLKQLLKPLKERIWISLTYRHDPLYREWYFKHSKRLLQFKDLHRGEDCFIIGNGPSLNEMDLKPLKNYHTFGLNKIYIMFDKINLNLSYHVAVNRLIIEQSVNEFEALACPSFLSFRAARDKVRHLDHIYMIETGGVSHMFQEDIVRKIFEGYTVTFVALQIAYYMGFQNCYLIGVDHSFKAVGNPNEIQLLTGEDPNHFDPRYFSNSNWQLPDLEGSELSYRLAKFHFERTGRKIYDATVGGKLQIFQKISFEEALDISREKAS